ncbi:hypothetical protein GT037_006272 [Alternaria burnsii]|uniref:Uncharacterized protein n=1 Tax=Alternaria burnsii TaxID=1187904 RepID=A0A8H7EER4_9PLEO|nr:uncharacterized protein GT037_006272 [Alternaria burnsii]KAF7675553.1 hypothetical protein GT037_006272 [Alternaria burnsii]
MQRYQRSLNTAEAGALNISRSKIALRASLVTRPQTKRVYTFHRADHGARVGFTFYRYYAGPSIIPLLSH